MTRRMLIDATHPEETRVTVVSGNRLEEFDYETTTKQQVKGNIYLAKVTRVEPSLQAAFVEYGGNRHGFLAFSEIHPDYYRIPVSDREELVEDGDGDDDDETGENGEGVEAMGAGAGVDEAVEEAARRRPRLKRQYKIQEVIKRRQVMLVQVVKEERGTKGAALTTYLSLAGRYCVVMPNTSRGGGVSRKIANAQDRKRLKTILSDLEVPDGMAVILRTAGAERSKAEVKRDFDYIMRLWDEIRETTLASTAPALIHEEGSLIKRAIRDLYTKDIEEVLVAGDEGYRIAKDFMRALIPSHAKKVQRYKDDQGIPLLHRYQVEQQLAQIHDPTVQLKSGGSIVIHQTEALVAIDVNSGKSTRERHIEETAYKTNLEAAEEVARQLRLRDLAGLIVIDFIDMDENRNANAVERRLKEALRRDRARIQVGKISAFGLLEMSRQRLRPSLLEAMSQPCPTCGGVGYIVSTESAALMVTRAIEEEGLRRRASEITVKLPGSVALYILNHKRHALSEMEERYGFTVTVEAVDGMLPPAYEIARAGGAPDAVEDAGDSESENTGRRGGRNRSRDEEDGEDGGSRRRGKRGGRRRGRNRDDADEDVDRADSDSDEEGDDTAGERGRSDDDGSSDANEDGTRSRRKRGRRGGRRRNRKRNDQGEGGADQTGEDRAADDTGSGGEMSGDETRDETRVAEPDVGDSEGDAPKPAKRARRSRKKAAAAKPDPAPAEGDPDAVDAGNAPEAAAEATKAKPAKKARRKSAAKKAAAKSAEPAEPAAQAGADSEPTPTDATPTDATPTEAPQSEAPQSEAGQSEAADSGASDPAPAPSEPEPANATDDAEPDKPKRRGWWNRVLG